MDGLNRTDNAKTKRVELHLHTRMSAMDGVADIKKVIERAAQWRHSAIAITDHGVVQAFPEAARASAKIAKDGGNIKVIYGLEEYFCIGEPLSDELPNSRRFHLTLLAKNERGLKNLYKIVTLSHTEHYSWRYDRPIIYKGILEEYRGGLLIGSACGSGELFAAILSGEDDETLCKIAGFYDYLEVQPVSNNMYMLRGDDPRVKSDDELRLFNRKIVELGEELNIPVVATSDAHILDPEDAVIRDIILCGKGYKYAGYHYKHASKKQPLYLRTTEEMLSEFDYLGEETAYKVVVENTNKIAEMCDEISPLPPKEHFYAPELGGRATLDGVVGERFLALYGGKGRPPIIDDRVDNECIDITGWDYPDVYIAAHKLAAHLKSEGACVSSRGAAGSSFVAYLAGITDINPLPAHYRCPACKTVEFPAQSFDTAGYCHCGADLPSKTCSNCGSEYIKDGFNIPFETFAGIDGDKIPDFDFNISEDHRNMAVEFLYELFDEKHVIRAGTIATVNERLAGFFVENYLNAAGKTISEEERNRLIQECIGVKHRATMHPGGLIIIPQNVEITDFCPIQYPSDGDCTIIASHFNYHDLTDNFLRLDILSHDSQTMLHQLREMTGINPDDINLDDPYTMSIFTSPAHLGLPEDDEIIGKIGTIGVPEFGTESIRQMLYETKPERFDALIRSIGLIHGEGTWDGNAKELISSGTASITDVISSRDDIMLYLISKGMEKREAFEISESVRKGMGIPEQYKDKLQNIKIPEWYMDSCGKIGYLFPRAHATAYAITAFRIAWYKVHKPLAFYGAYFHQRKSRGAFDSDTIARGIEAVKTEYGRIEKLCDRTIRDEALLTTMESCYEFYTRGYDFSQIVS